MTNTQRAAMQDALEALNVGIREMNARACGIECMPLHYAKKALREALAEPAVEPVTRISLKDGKYLKLDPFYFLGPVCWILYTENDKQIRALDEFESGFVNAALKASPPTEVPLLTDAEILAIMRDGNNCNYNDEGEHIDFARAVEQTIRTKLGLK